jgi:hypothetical protein
MKEAKVGFSTKREPEGKGKGKEVAYSSSDEGDDSFVKRGSSM